MQNARKASAEWGTRAGHERLRVLVIADSEEVGLTLRRILRRLGHLPVPGCVIEGPAEEFASVFDRNWDIAVIRVASKLLSEAAWARFFARLSRRRERMVLAGDGRACTIIASRRSPEDPDYLLLALALTLGKRQWPASGRRSKTACRSERPLHAGSTLPPSAIGG